MGSGVFEKLTPLPHQLVMRDYLIDNDGGLLFCEMRTGKTFGAILYLLWLEYTPILIMAPCNAIQNWYNWLISQGFPEDSVSIATGTRPKRLKELDKRNPILICNYEMSIKYKIKRHMPWEVIIFDESFKMANESASVTQYWLRGGKPDDQVRIGLTGDPAPETPLNLVTQYMIIKGDFMGYTSYPKYYKDNWRKCDFSGRNIPLSIVHEDKMREYVSKTAHCVTMESLGLGSETLYNITTFEMNAKQKKWMKKVMSLRKEAKMFKGINPVENPYSMKARAMERAVAAGIDPETHEIIDTKKIDFIVEHYLETKEPIVVLSTFKAPLYGMAEALKAKGIDYALIHGTSGSPKEKDDLEKAFLRGEFPFMIGQTDAVMMNYNFSVSSVTFYLNNGYKRNPRSQSEKRTTNVNKKTPVEIHDMCYLESMDKDVVKVLKSKGDVSYSFIDKKLDEMCG